MIGFIVLIAGCSTETAPAPSALPAEPAAVSTPPVPAPAPPVPAPPASEPTPPAARTPPEVRACAQGIAPKPPWRVAAAADLAPGMVEAVTGPGAPPPSCPTVVAVDLDGDGRDDIAQLEVEQRVVRLRLVLTGSGQARSVRVWPALPEELGGPVATWLFSKPPGERVYREWLDPEVRDVLARRGAVKVCEPPGGPDAVPTAPADQWCYCSSWMWIDDGAVQMTTVCD